MFMSKIVWCLASKTNKSKRSTSKMNFAINALLSESDDDDEDLLNDATQLLEEDDTNKTPGINY